MKYLHTSTLFDADLSPKTALYKGYEYIDDVILDILHMNGNDFLKVIAENSFKLGIPSKNEYGNYGLYIPINEFNNTTQ